MPKSHIRLANPETRQDFEVIDNADVAANIEAFKQEKGHARAGYGRQPVDNADATPVRPPRMGGLRGQAHQ